MFFVLQKFFLKKLNLSWKPQVYTTSLQLVYTTSLHCFMWFLLYYLLHLFSSDRFPALTGLYPYKIFIWIYQFLQNYPRRTVYCNINLSNLENVLQRNLRTESTRKCIFRASGGTNFGNFSTLHQPWLHLCGFRACTGLPPKILDTSLKI